MKKKDVVKYSPPRRDSWLAKLSEDERLDALSLRRRMPWQDALKYLKENYGITISRTSYFKTTKRYATNEIAVAHCCRHNAVLVLNFIFTRHSRIAIVYSIMVICELVGIQLIFITTKIKATA